MVAEMPKSVKVRSRFSVQVIVADNPAAEVLSEPLPGVVGGSTVTVNATVPESFKVSGELTQDISVPRQGDSKPSLFTFTPTVIGSFPLRLTAFNGGTYLGKLEVEISVANETAGTSRETMSSLSTTDAREGEVSLQITYDDASQTFRFLFIAGGDRREVPSLPIKGDIRQRIETLIPEFDSYAQANSGLSEAEAQQRMRVRGFELWRDLVPEPIKAAILDHIGDIAQLTIFCDREVVPWELLYPQTPTGDEPGFLVGLFPVNRWVMANAWTDRLSLSAPTFVVPDPSPPQADQEVAGIAQMLQITEPPTLRNRRQLLDSLKDPRFSFLHFACHNRFSPEAGSQIGFTDGAFMPSDLVPRV